MIFNKSVFFWSFIYVFSSFGCTVQHNNDSGSDESNKSMVKKEPFGYPNYLNKTFLQGHFFPGRHPDFILIPDSLRSGLKMYLQKDVLLAFTKMHDEMIKNGHSIFIISATRSFNYQKRIWLRKWLGQIKLDGNINARDAYPDHNQRALKILEYSSMPGTSRHHWGTDIDINSLNNKYFTKGKGLALYNWMTDHASEYGFCQTYTEMDSLRPNGYQEEKWHWSYTPISSVLTKTYGDSLNNRDIEGFIGNKVASELDIINKYVLGVNQACN